MLTCVTQLWGSVIKRYIEYELVVVVMDISKAFDRVWHDVRRTDWNQRDYLWNSLEKELLTDRSTQVMVECVLRHPVFSREGDVNCLVEFNAEKSVAF